MDRQPATLRRRPGDDTGFALIELMVVVLIIAILIAIAIPTFLGTKQRAQHKSAQSSLRNVLTNAKVLYTDNNTYVAATTAGLTATEKSLTFTAAASTGPKVVSVATNATGIVLAARSAAGVCFVLGDKAVAPVAGTWYRNLGAATCTAPAATTLPATVPIIPNATAGGAWALNW